MPGLMFADVVSSRARSSRRWYTVPLSLLAHALLFALVIAVPLIATDVLPPEPRGTLLYELPDVVPVVPVVAHPPSSAARQAPATATSVSPGVAPIEAPSTIAPETGVLPDDGFTVTRGIEGLIEGLGSAGAGAEVVPPAPLLTPVLPGGDIKPPVRIKHVLPEYPPIARSVRKEGVVIIQAIIGVDGKVQEANVTRSVDLLDQAALDAVRQWEYTPTLLNGRPTPVIMTVTVRFALN